MSQPLVPENVSDLLGKEELWHEAWRRRQIGQPVRQIAQTMGISVTTVRRYIQNWEATPAGADMAQAERKHQLATLTEMEQRIWRDAELGRMTWVAAAGAIRKIFKDRRELLNIQPLNAQVAPQPRVGGETPGLPKALQVILAGLEAGRSEAPT